MKCLVSSSSEEVSVGLGSDVGLEVVGGSNGPTKSLSIMVGCFWDDVFNVCEFIGLRTQTRFYINRHGQLNDHR